MLLNPTWLVSFKAVAQTLNFTAAANRLRLRQSTVSEHVRKLEMRCGRRLFVRDTHSVTLTAAGEAMLGFATTILETNSRAENHFARGEMAGHIRLGVSEDVVLRGLPEILRRFRHQHPRVELRLTVGLSEDMRRQLDARELDLVFLKRRVGDTHGRLVWREPLVWIASPDFRLDADEPAPLIVLAPPALTRTAALDALEAEGRRWHIVCTSASQSGIHAAVLAGLGVAPHARALTPPGVGEVSNEFLPSLGDIEFALLANKEIRSGPIRALARTIEEHGPVLRKRET